MDDIGVDEHRKRGIEHGVSTRAPPPTYLFRNEYCAACFGCVWPISSSFFFLVLFLDVYVAFCYLWRCVRKTCRSAHWYISFSVDGAPRESANRGCRVVEIWGRTTRGTHNYPQMMDVCIAPRALRRCSVSMKRYRTDSSGRK